MAKKNDKKPKVHDELKGFEISINEFGEIKTNMNVDKLNKFLDEKVEDKKLIEKDLSEGEQADED